MARKHENSEVCRVYITVIYGRPLIAGGFLMVRQYGFAVIYPAC